MNQVPALGAPVRRDHGQREAGVTKGAETLALRREFLIALMGEIFPLLGYNATPLGKSPKYHTGKGMLSF